MAAAKKDDDATTWRSPAQGWESSQPDLELRLETYYRELPDLADLHAWELMAQLATLLGPHRLELHSHAEAKALYNTPADWRSSGGSSGGTLRLSTHDLATEAFWRGVMAPITKDGWRFTACRGGGATRHRVWSLKMEAYPRSPVQLRFNLMLRHVHPSAAPEVQEFALKFFALAATSGDCVYGRGELLRWEDDEDTIGGSLGAGGTLDRLVKRELWRDAPIVEKPLVPGAFWANFLGNAHMDKLGSATELRERRLRITTIEGVGYRPKFLTFPNGHCLVLLGPLEAFHLQRTSNWDWNHAHSFAMAATWLTHEYGKAGLLVEQELGWYDRVLRDWEEQRAVIAARSAADAADEYSPVQGADAVEYMTYFWQNPPRCVRPVAAVADPKDTHDEDNRFHALTTHFYIRPDGHDEAYTVYGRPTRESPLLASPIRIGSPKADRAVFAFDAASDGWDGEWRDKTLPSPPARMKQLVCPSCQGRLFRLRAAFEYPGDDEGLDDSARERRQDFFTWFWLVARCASCGRRDVVADVECA